MTDGSWAPGLDADTVHRLLRHEAIVHSMGGRALRELGDSILLYDEVEQEPFWNRVEAIRWPVDPKAFDRRLAEIGVLFASIGRQPHVWTAPPHDEPADLVERLLANGFQDAGKGFLLVARDVGLARAVLADRPIPADAVLDRVSAVSDAAIEYVAADVVSVLIDAFRVDPERRPGIVEETRLSLADPRFTHYLVRRDGRPVAVARRATFDGISYLSSIGTIDAVRGLGFGRLVTATAMIDAAAAGSEWIHLGVFADNVAARQLYGTLGFVPSGEPAPDMILVG